MGQEIDLLINYPKTKRDIQARLEAKSDDVRHIARKFGKDFFDGDRQYGYGGFTYHPRFWQPVIPTLQEYFHLNANSSVLDVGCAKGFFMLDLCELIPGITVRGVDISEYAVKNTMETMKPHVLQANAMELPFDDNSFDVVISINTVHNLEYHECGKALAEIERVSRNGSFITVDAYRNDQEKEIMFAWNLTGKTILHVDEWRSLFSEYGYHGDYYWFIP
ncbi:MAG: methyltransferase domain-containing protein [Candidatus Marinimicrobia bacterium]|nr:methyltransferase domain-containing protein [Candidatus Neomarinimicrobiota bacterium]